MLKSIIVGIVTFCTWLAWPVIILDLLLTAASSYYAVRPIGINADTSQLISGDAPWRQPEIAYDKAFPHRAQLILVVVQAPTPELTKRAADALAQRLSGRTDQFRSVRQPEGAFFEQNAFLFASTE